MKHEGHLPEQQLKGSFFNKKLGPYNQKQYDIGINTPAHGR